ncbi:hypothetical protein LCGC14_2866270 [marine sediment metagenome]|uniref:VRR-NUC domain-containing protein n=1 Tax=marine sediment metagenome TaxID=412755 RepID=A0A0F9ACE5_9ZZZZ
MLWVGGMTGGAANVLKGKATERAVAKFYRLIGRCIVYQNSDPGQRKGKNQHRGTPGRTPGLPDMMCYHEPTSSHWWHEAKAGSGKLTTAQRTHKLVAMSCDLRVVVGGVEEAGAYLVSQGIVRQVDGVWEYIGPKERK